MPELAQDDRQRNSLMGHLDRVRVTKLVRREPAANSGLGGELSQLSSRPCR